MATGTSEGVVILLFFVAFAASSTCGGGGKIKWQLVCGVIR